MISDGDGLEGALERLNLDFDRERRCGFPEVIFAPGKSRQELAEAGRTLLKHHGQVLVTRLDPDDGEWLAKELEEGRFHSRARCFTACRHPKTLQGQIALLCAGTSDIPVAEEARITAQMTGSRVSCHYDVGVAGLHRVLELQEPMRLARVIVVVAGMEGALPSVVAGLSSRPVIAVPTSIGYGASFGGVAALLTMLNSCAGGVSVVNIDNGFAAGLLASRINRLPPLPETEA
ncbi:MAG: nickel pincer cofactor biosynthesis protein LarB [Planctomycetota bacterium]